MTNEIIASALNAQYNHERQNAALYEALAGAFAYMNLEGFEKFMTAQAAEERTHAQKFFDYLNALGVMPTVTALDAFVPALGSGVYTDTLGLFQTAYAAEVQNEIALAALAQLVEENGDQTSEAFLNPILLDQRQSIHEFEVWLTKLQIAQGDGAALLALNEDAAG